MRYKNKVYEISDIIGDARRDNLWGLGDVEHKRPYYVFMYKDICDRKSPVYKYFNTIEKAQMLINTIKDELKRGLYNENDYIS